MRMVTDQQVRRLMMLLQQGLTQQAAADRTAMAVNTARKYRRSGRLPSQCRPEHTWRTRDDPFDDAWEGIRERLESEPRLQARTLFDVLQREHPGRFADGQLRTLQRRIRQWRCLSGPLGEVFFAQVHRPGVLCQSDFTDTGKLGITIGGASFDHLLYHFVLTYSNWEHCTVCFSESF
ncbi:MAG TPA: IS21 family transposase, partial [Planctomycetota bacterium]|nr:IS21 family transposase [Planctomycetota bacterium]